MRRGVVLYSRLSGQVWRHDIGFCPTSTWEGPYLPGMLGAARLIL